MDDERIAKLAAEVLAAVRQSPAEREAVFDLEARVAAVEAALRRIAGGRPATAIAAVVAVPTGPAPASHPSLRLVDVPGGEEHCILETDQPCVKSGRCRSFGF